MHIQMIFIHISYNFFLSHFIYLSMTSLPPSQSSSSSHYLFSHLLYPFSSLSLSLFLCFLLSTILPSHSRPSFLISSPLFLYYLFFFLICTFSFSHHFPINLSFLLFLSLPFSQHNTPQYTTTQHVTDNFQSWLSLTPACEIVHKPAAHAEALVIGVSTRTTRNTPNRNL